MDNDYFDWYTQHLQETTGLTKRQSQVLALESANYTTKEIADELGISKNTVQNHFQAITKQLLQAQHLQNMVAPHPWDGIRDPHGWELRSQTEYISNGQYTHITLYAEFYGSWLAVIRKHTPTDTAGELQQEITRKAYYDGDDLCHDLYGSERFDTFETAVLRCELIAQAGIDPKHSPTERYTGDIDDYEETINQLVDANIVTEQNTLVTPAFLRGTNEL